MELQRLCQSNNVPLAYWSTSECSTASVLSAAQGKVTFRETGFSMVVYAHVHMFQIP